MLNLNIRQKNSLWFRSDFVGERNPRFFDADGRNLSVAYGRVGTQNSTINTTRTHTHALVVSAVESCHSRRNVSRRPWPPANSLKVVPTRQRILVFPLLPSLWPPTFCDFHVRHLPLGLFRYMWAEPALRWWNFDGWPKIKWTWREKQKVSDVLLYDMQMRC